MRHLTAREWVLGFEEALINEKIRTTEARAGLLPFLFAAVEAEYGVMEAERRHLAAMQNLIPYREKVAQAKLATAEIELQIIPHLYDLLDAQALVLEAEKRRAAALSQVLVYEQELAEVKKEMIPLLKEKAAARMRLADSTISEASWRQRIEELGYTRIQLKETQELADRQVRSKELTNETMKLERVTAESMLEIARVQARTALAEYEALIKNAVIDERKELHIDERTFRLALQWYWKNFDLLHDIMLMEFEKGLISTELATRLSEIITAAKDQCITVRDSARRASKHEDGTTLFQYISKG